MKIIYFWYLGWNQRTRLYSAPWQPYFPTRGSTTRLWRSISSLSMKMCSHLSGIKTLLFFNLLQLISGLSNFVGRTVNWSFSRAIDFKNLTTRASQGLQSNPKSGALNPPYLAKISLNRDCFYSCAVCFAAFNFFLRNILINSIYHRLHIGSIGSSELSRTRSPPWWIWTLPRLSNYS